jgi:Collagen triple helix repeat (20 copies)
MHLLAGRLRRNAIAYLALFVALGGVSYAAVTLPSGSVGTKQLKRGAVTLKKIAPKAKAALKGQTGDTGPRGAAGATGATGATGAKGDTGAPGAKGETGSAGADGTNGAPGTPAAAVLTQARAVTSPTTTSGDNVDSDLPLQSASFQQPANGTVLVVAAATATTPTDWSTHACPGTGVSVTYFVDGVQVGALGFSFFGISGNGVPQSTAAGPNAIAVDPGASSTRTITAKVRDSCDDRDFQITNVRVNVYSIG